MRLSWFAVASTLLATACSSGGPSSTTATGGSGAGTSSGGTTGSTTAGTCPPLDATNELADCSNGKACPGSMSCNTDPNFGQLCEYACSTTADCPDIETVCFSGYCVVNVCGAGVNGVYDGKCNAAGTDDGICFPVDSTGDGGNAAVGVCLRSGTATSVCSVQAGCDLGSVCQAGWFCNASSSHSATGSCVQLCDPGDSIGVCPAGQGCQADSSDLGTCVASQDPCNGVPTSGQCVNSSTVEFCSAPTGSGTPQVRSYDCVAGTACTLVDAGAKCVVTGECVDGATQCTSSTELETCVSGSWQTEACPNGCAASATGSACAPAVGLASVSVTFQYEFQGTDSATAPTGWSPTVFDAPAQEFLVLSYAGDPQQLIDSQLTDGNGTVTINVPSSPSASDVIALVAASVVTVNGQLVVQYAVADPGFTAAGQQSAGTSPPNPSIWSWSVPSNQLSAGEPLTVQLANGSGAARVFDYVRYAHEYAGSQEGSAGGTMVAWLGFGTSWDCGSCFYQAPISFSGLSFDAQTWYGGDTADQRWWADPVTAHEQGHWTMYSFGTPPGEGGQHEIGVPGFPGLAWSEGWATWFSSDVRTDPVYYDMQGGTFFWLNIAAQGYGDGTPWYLPSPSAGVIQFLDENQVSHMLWSLSSSAAAADGKLFTALSSAHMNHSPWPEGYTRYTFQLDPSNCDPSSPATCYTNVANTGVAAPCFADFLDALDCAGAFSTAVIDGATVPATQYPYPSGAPLCP